MNIEGIGESFERQPQHEMSVNSASRALALVMFPRFPNPHELVTPLQELNRQEIIRLIEENYSEDINSEVQIDDYEVDPRLAYYLRVSLDDIKTVRRAVVSFGIVHLLHDAIPPGFRELATRKPYAQYKTYQEFLRTALYNLIAEPQLEQDGKEDPIKNYFIHMFSPILMLASFSEGHFLNGVSFREKDSFAWYQRHQRTSKNRKTNPEGWS